MKKLRIALVLAMAIVLLAGAAAVTAIGMSDRELQVRAGITNCLITERGSQWGLSRDLTVSRISCTLFKIRNGIAP